MFSYLKASLKNYPNIKLFLRSPLKWVYAAYLTLRYADEWHVFPAFQINGKMSLKLKKDKSAKIIIKNRLIFEQWLSGDGVTGITLAPGAQFIVENDFVLGNGIQVYLAPSAMLVVKGKMHESGSGITANSVILVKKYLEIGADCIIAWDTFLTDCDWHGIDGKNPTKDTIIEDHVWIGVGAKILKGAHIKKNCIVTGSSIVLGGQYPERSLLSGNPAKVIKADVAHWHREMPDSKIALN